MNDDSESAVEASGRVVSRRTVLRATAWTAPVVGLATVAPAAAAASLVITDPLLPGVENPLPIPEPNLPQIPVPSDLKTVPPPIPGIPPGPGQPSVVLPDKIPPKIFKPRNPAQASADEPTEAPESSSPPPPPEPQPTPEPEPEPEPTQQSTPSP